MGSPNTCTRAHRFTLVETDTRRVIWHRCGKHAYELLSHGTPEGCEVVVDRPIYGRRKTY
jgi:hypothetical protein